MFKDHHYLDGNVNKASRCYIGVWDDQVIGFSAVLTLPSGTLKNAWRSSRLCILPEFQGLGIGTRFSDAIGQIYLDQNYRFFARCSHPKLIDYRENSHLWKPTSKHKKIRKDISEKNIYKGHIYDDKRLCGSFEFIGDKLIIK